jgi:hypothetical protein
MTRIVVLYFVLVSVNVCAASAVPRALNCTEAGPLIVTASDVLRIPPDIPTTLYAPLGALQPSLEKVNPLPLRAAITLQFCVIASDRARLRIARASSAAALTAAVRMYPMKDGIASIDKTRIIPTVMTSSTNVKPRSDVFIVTLGRSSPRPRRALGLRPR